MSKFKVINEYEFTVAAKPLLPDFQRIVDENCAAEYIFVLLKQPRKEATNNCLLLLKKAFVSSFSEKDGLIVAGEKLCENWGYYSATKISECFFSMPLNWKYRENGDVPVEKFIKNCLNEIRQALDYKNKVTYKVISFC